MKLAVSLAMPILLALTPCAGAAAGVEPSDCPVPGEKMHWIADFCMATLETDDEIPAGPCINRESRRRFKTECVAKLHYKKALCELAISRGVRKDGLGDCLADTAFAGSTVRNQGVGGASDDRPGSADGHAGATPDRPVAASPAPAR